MPYIDELTFDDVFIVPQLSFIPSRFDVDLTPPDASGNIPLVIANMTALSGADLAATVARRGGISILSQYLSVEELVDIIGKVQNLTYYPPSGIKSAVRATVYEPNLNHNNLLNVGVAVGINGDYAAKIDAVTDLGVTLIVVDTAHGHQIEMLRIVDNIRSKYPYIRLVAGNVVTQDGVKALSNVGADIVKVGIGPGAVCTTRMMTGVGRPQFSAIKDCAEVAQTLGTHIWADGGIKNPRDVALALAAGASNVMIGSMFVGTLESPGPLLSDGDRQYKVNYGMASTRAVKERNIELDAFERVKREMFSEGISESKIYINPNRPGAEDIIDWLMSGLRSAMTYTGAKNIREFQNNVIIGTQSSAGYREGQALDKM